jgi:TPR repeat protein
MSTSDYWRSLQSSLSYAGHSGLATIAGGAAETAEAVKKAREQEKREQQAILNGVNARIETGQMKAAMFGTSLPENFVSMENHPALIGQFPKHPDGHDIRQLNVILEWLAANRPDSYPQWTRAYTMAVLGLQQPQFILAKALETGEDGIQPDLARAFFYYYRAGMQGHVEAQQGASRLNKVGGFAWTIDPPYLIHPGHWEIAQDKFGEMLTTRHFSLLQNGTLTGRLVGADGAAGYQLQAIASMVPGIAKAVAAVGAARLSGRWQFDRESRTLTLQVLTEIPGFGAQAPELSQIRITGARFRFSDGLAPVFYGTDESQFPHFISARPPQ